MFLDSFSDLFSFEKTETHTVELSYRHRGFERLICDEDDRIIRVDKITRLPHFADLNRLITPAIQLVHKVCEETGYTPYSATPKGGVRCGQVVVARIGAPAETVYMVALEDHEGFVVKNLGHYFGDGAERAPFAWIKGEEMELCRLFEPERFKKYERMRAQWLGKESSLT